MSGQAKIELLLELKNKIKTGITKARNNINSRVKEMKEDLCSLKEHHVKAFSAMREEIPMLDKAMRLLGNPYVLITAGAVALSVALGGAMSKAADFNSEFVNIQNLNLDKSKESLADYKTSILDTAMTVGTGAKETAKAFYDVQSATGKYGDDAKQIVASVGKYSIATGAKLEDSINSTTKAMKAFGLGVQDIDGYLASNAKTVQVGITTFDELARVQTEYAGAASGAGQNVDTANKVFAAFTSIAKDSATAATMTKSAFEGLTQKNTITGLKEIGIRMYDAKGNMRDLGTVLQEVSGKFKDMSPEAIDEIINKIGGPEGLRNMFVKLKTDSKDFFNTLEAFDSSSFDLDKALENALADFNTLKKSVGERFGTLIASLGSGVLPVATSILKGVNNGLLWLYDNMGLIKDVLTSVTYGVAAAATAWAVMNAGTVAFAASYYGLVIAQKAATVAQWALNLSLWSNPIGMVIAAIALLVAAFVLAYKRLDKFRAFVDGLWASMKALGTYIKDGFLASFISAWEVIKGFFSNMWNGIKNLIGGIADSFGGLGKIIKSALSFNWDGVTEGVTKLRSGIVRAGSGMIDAIPLTNIAKNYKAYGKTASDTFNSEFAKNAENRVNIGDTYTNAHQKSLKESREKAKEKKSAEESKVNPLSTSEPPLTPTAGIPSAATSGMSNITGGSSKPRNVSITIDSFIKGGLNVNSNETEGKSVEQIEEMLSDMFYRMIRNAETSMS